MIAPTSASPLSLPHRTPRTLVRIPIRPPEIRPRFTGDGGRELEDHLERTCTQIAAGIRGLVPRRRLEGILLGGGYGRGEGGVLRMGTAERPYNDLEFYVFLRGNRHWNERRFGRSLHVLGEILSPQAGVEVEFKIASLAEFEASPISMFSYDLVMGHHRLAGGERLLERCAHHREAEQIPLAEATRLLMNRCTGLLLAQERLGRNPFTATDADFVRRNIAKAELALGDAMLVALGQYHWSVRERHRQIERIARLESSAWVGAVRQRHASGVEFKLHPERSTASREQLQAQHTPVTALAAEVWLWIEQRRLRTAFPTMRDYVASRVDRYPELTGGRSVLVNLKTLGLGALLSPRTILRHPRQRTLTVLPLLLWQPAALGDPAWRRVVQRALQTTATSFAEVMDAYRRLWSQVT